jgi:Protein of unknown function (DUF1566).
MRISPLMVLLSALTVSLSTASAEQRCDTTQHPLSAPTNRFTDNGDGTVTDQASGLMWMRCALGQEWQDGACSGSAKTYAWPASQGAVDVVNSSGEQFFSDWRVPGLRDLAMIIERECVDPRINLTVFPDTPTDFFWTSTPRADDADQRVYALSFGPEGVEPHAPDLTHYLRLVRTAR